MGSPDRAERTAASGRGGYASPLTGAGAQLSIWGRKLDLHRRHFARVMSSVPTGRRGRMRFRERLRPPPPFKEVTVAPARVDDHLAHGTTVTSIDDSAVPQASLL